MSIHRPEVPATGCASLAVSYTCEGCGEDVRFHEDTYRLLLLAVRQVLVDRKDNAGGATWLHPDTVRFLNDAVERAEMTEAPA